MQTVLASLEEEEALEALKKDLIAIKDVFVDRDSEQEQEQEADTEENGEPYLRTECFSSLRKSPK